MSEDAFNMSIRKYLKEVTGLNHVVDGGIDLP